MTMNSRRQFLKLSACALAVPAFARSTVRQTAWPAAKPIRAIHSETSKALALPEVQQKLAAQGVEPAPLTPSEMDARIRREIALNIKIAKDAGLKFN
jgi:tripartite-type tricarboxylate transporter receptor subunit TctC